jgi:hypothetical protein
MKAEHRKELETNILADRMGRMLQGMKSAPKGTSALIWVFVILALVTIVAWRWYASSVRNDRSALWTSLNRYSEEQIPAQLHDLQTLFEDHRGTIAGRAARFQEARLRLRDGQRNLTTRERDHAIQDVDRARAIYRELIDACPDEPILEQEALMGVASAEESLVGVHYKPEKSDEEITGNLATAIEYYQRLAAKYPNSVNGGVAKKRLEKLGANEKEIESFYAQLSDLATVKPLPPAEQTIEPKPNLDLKLPPSKPTLLPEEPVKVAPTKPETKLPVPAVPLAPSKETQNKPGTAKAADGKAKTDQKTNEKTKESKKP